MEVLFLVHIVKYVVVHLHENILTTDNLRNHLRFLFSMFFTVPWKKPFLLQENLDQFFFKAKNVETVFFLIIIC